MLLFPFLMIEFVLWFFFYNLNKNDIMKKIYGFLTAALVAFSLNAQTSGQIATYTPGVGAETDGLYNYAMGSVSDKLEKLSYEDGNIEGSPYMSNTFSPAQLYDGSESVGNIFYRYNAYNEEIEIKLTNSEDEPLRGLGKDKKIRVVSNNSSLSFKTFIDKNGNTKNGYLTLLKDGDYKLYKHLKVDFKDAQKAASSLVQGRSARFTQSTAYYMEVEGKNLIKEIQLNNKKLVNSINVDKQKSLQDYMKEQNLKLKTESDLLNVFQFLNN